MTGEGQWTAIRIAYHDADKTPLLVGAIGPIVEKLRDFGASRAIFKPHWRRGPHVDFGLQLDPSASGGGFPDRARQSISAWIEANPSTAALESVRYLQLSMKLATAEGVEGPFLPLLANNSLVALAEDRFPPSPDDALAGIRDRFQADTLPLLIQLARLKDDRERFWGTLAEMMMCVAQFSGPAGMRGGHISYRSHAEGFLSGAAPLRPRFEDFSNELGARTISGIEEVRDAFAPDGSFSHSDPLLEDWVKHVRVCKDALDQATSAMSAETLLIHSSVTGDRDQGAFEKMIVNGALRELRGNPQFVAYRLMLNNFYGLLPTIGVTPLERFALCFLVAEASEKVFRVNWRKALAGGSGGGWLGRMAGFVMALARR